MFQSLDLLVLSCLLLTIESHRGQILPPQNVSLRWNNGFQPELSWAPPQHSLENCKYEGISKTTGISDNHSDIKYNEINSPWLLDVVMEGGFLHLTVETVCNKGRHSQPVVINCSYPELVRNLQCYIHSPKKTHCSWLLASHVPDLRFYYRLYYINSRDAPAATSSPNHIYECSSYRHTDGVRTGCDLEASVDQGINILFNATLNNTPVWNTFSKMLENDVRPPSLMWTVRKDKDKFIIQWTPPDITRFWTYTINYTECNVLKMKQADDGETSMVLDMLPHCPYRMAVQAKTMGGQTPWTKEKYFAADADPKAWLYAAAIIPLIFAGLAVLIFMCCRKNKEHMFPKVPVPRDFLSDISDNNNKSTVLNLYTPAKEEENCKISLVVDPQINTLDL